MSLDNDVSHQHYVRNTYLIIDSHQKSNLKSREPQQYALRLN
jgi:hypothetical protein